MAIPYYQQIMLPLLRRLLDEKPHAVGALIKALSEEFNLSNDEKKKLLKSGKQEVFNNRVGWARTYLKKAGLIKSTGWGVVCITEKGKALLANNLSKIDVKMLLEYPEFRDFIKAKPKKQDGVRFTSNEEKGTPKEILESVVEQLNNSLEKDILTSLNNVSPSRFEHIVIDLLVGMGYGGSHEDAARAIGGPGDEGLDGEIQEDKLGLNKIYVQAKRWQDRNINHNEIRNFVGSLDVRHADKGVFITTSTFNRDAKEAADRSSKKIILIDGQRLAKLMIMNDIGVSTEDTIKVRKVDMDYFVDDYST